MEERRIHSHEDVLDILEEQINAKLGTESAIVLVQDIDGLPLCHADIKYEGTDEDLEEAINITASNLMADTPGARGAIVVRIKTTKFAFPNKTELVGTTVLRNTLNERGQFLVDRINVTNHEVYSYAEGYGD